MDRAGVSKLIYVTPSNPTQLPLTRLPYSACCCIWLGKFQLA